MKILLSWQICVVGGVETWMLGLGRTFKALGHECELFFFKHGPFEQFIPPEMKAHFGDLDDLVRLVHEQQFDVVQAATIDWDLGISAVRRMGAKLILHGNGWVHPAWNASNCDAIVGCSHWNAKAQQKLTDIPVQVVRNGISLERFPLYEGPIKGPPIVAWVGRGSDTHQKQIDRLAAVAHMLREGGARLWLADPDGPDKVPQDAAKILKATAERWERIPPQSMTQFFHDVAASGGCVLSTSKFEGLSLAYLEAQACGVPIIGPDVIGVNESFDVNLGGVLHHADIKPADLARLVLETLGDTEKMNWRRKASRQFVVDNCTFDKTARQYLQVYENAPYRRRWSADSVRSRLALSPLNWRTYVENRWTAGACQFAASERFYDAGQIELARGMLRESISMAPTMFVRRKRLGHARRVFWGSAPSVANRPQASRV